MRAWGCTQTDIRTEANWIYNLSHAICYSYGTDNKWSNNLMKGRIAILSPLAEGKWILPTLTPCNTRFLGPTWISFPNGISIASAIFEHAAHPCVQHTHRDTQTTLSVAIGRIYAMHAMRSYNIHRIAKKCLYTTMSTTSQMMTDFHKKLNYRRGTARRTVSVEILSTSAQQYENTFEKECSRGIILKVTQR